MRPGSSPTGLPRLYMIALGREIIVSMALMLLAVEAIYLSNKMVTHLLFDTLRNQLGIVFLIETLVLAAPEILSVGFPLATIIAVYLALLRRREAGDLLILSGAGVSPWTLIGLSVVLGLLALTIAFGLRGFVEPLASRHLALRVVEGQFEAARQGRLNTGQFLTIGNTTLYQHPEASSDPAAAQNFLFQTITQTEEWVITATGSRLVDAPDFDNRFLELEEPQIIGFTRSDAQTYEVGATVAVDQMQIGPILIDLPDASAIGGGARNELITELVRRWLNEGDAASGQVLLERLLSMVLAFLAPLGASLALALTRGPMRLLAFPGALGAVLGGGLAIGPASEQLVGLGPGSALAWTASFVTVVGAGAALLTARLIPASVLPQRVQI